MRHREVHQAGREGLGADLAGKNFTLVKFAGSRDYLLIAELAGESLKLALLVGQVKADHRDCSRLASLVAGSLATRIKDGNGGDGEGPGVVRADATAAT